MRYSRDVKDWPVQTLNPDFELIDLNLLTGLDDEKVLGVDVGVLGKIVVLFGYENALCGDRVSAYPYMQQAAKMFGGAIAMARIR